MNCEYCQFVTPGHRCHECGTLKPKQIKVPDRPSRWFRGFMIIAITVAVFWLDRIHGVLKEIAEQPPVIIYQIRMEEPDYEPEPPKTTEAAWTRSGPTYRREAGRVTF